MLGAARGIDNTLPGQYLMAALWEVGPSRFADGSEMPILWQELTAYAKLMGTLKEPWEFRAIMDMSKAYVTEKTTGADPFRIPPVDREAMNG